MSFSQRCEPMKPPAPIMQIVSAFMGFPSRSTRAIAAKKNSVVVVVVVVLFNGTQRLIIYRRRRCDNYLIIFWEEHVFLFPTVTHSHPPCVRSFRSLLTRTTSFHAPFCALLSTRSACLPRFFFLTFHFYLYKIRYNNF